MYYYYYYRNTFGAIFKERLGSESWMLNILLILCSIDTFKPSHTSSLLDVVPEISSLNMHFVAIARSACKLSGESRGAKNRQFRIIWKERATNRSWKPRRLFDMAYYVYYIVANFSQQTPSSIDNKSVRWIHWRIIRIRISFHFSLMSVFIWKPKMKANMLNNLRKWTYFVGSIQGFFACHKLKAEI